MKEFKLKSDKKTRYGSLTEMKEALGIKNPQTVFDYCKNTKMLFTVKIPHVINNSMCSMIIREVLEYEVFCKTFTSKI